MFYPTSVYKPTSPYLAGILPSLVFGPRGEYFNRSFYCSGSVFLTHASRRLH
jgi:hypothetical protein